MLITLTKFVYKTKKMKKILLTGALLLSLCTKAQKYELDFTKRYLIDACTKDVVEKTQNNYHASIDLYKGSFCMNGATFKVKEYFINESGVTTIIFTDGSLISCQLGSSSDGTFYVGILNDKIDKLVYYYP